MLLAFMQTPLFELLLRFGIDIIAVVLLIYGLYYRRHHDKELVTTAVMFNFAAFGVLVVLSDVQFSVAAGFGLFAILALFRLRSEQFDKIEISYFFGAVAIAVICSVLKRGHVLGTYSPPSLASPASVTPAKSRFDAFPLVLI